jgi:hypothetical protein
MAGKNLDYWYDEQIKRYLIQLIRVFSNFQVKEITSTGVNYNRVPCRYADASRQVALIARKNSENTINNAPQITVAIQSVAPARDRIQEPYFVDTKQVAEREWDTASNQYTSSQGNLYTTKRYMPVPYNLTIQTDIWTTNTDTKLQLLEQILVIFNPSIQLQSNDNPLDWSSVFEVELTDIQWSSRTLPAGVDENLDIATLTFSVPIWISPPAKVMRQQIIQQIINDIYNTDSVADLGFNDAYYDFFGQLDKDAQVIVSPNDYKVSVTGGQAILTYNDTTPAVWLDLIQMQGELGAVSRMELNTTNDIEDRTKMVIGRVVSNPVDPSSLIFTVDTDTLPSDTLTDVTKIINPQSSRPGSGLDPQMLGQRYLITEDISPDYVEWGISANADDIIQYDGAQWTVVFDSQSVSSQEWLHNEYTNKQYTWTGDQWISSHEGVYNPGYWRLIL